MNTDFELASRVIGFSPGLVTAKFYETWDFYTEKLGFRTISEADDCVRLAHGSGAQLAILRHETDEQHPELVSPTDGHGFWLQLEVADVDGLYQRLSATGVPTVRQLEAAPGGSRSFAMRDPNGVLIRIEPVRAALR
jgi:catechol 2,3-dioxygenase-like lactoylglutathione lyase family enzyme